MCPLRTQGKVIFVVLGPPEFLDDVACISDHVSDGFGLRWAAELPDFHLGFVLRGYSRCEISSPGGAAPIQAEVLDLEGTPRSAPFL